ncbi:MAG: APC family permease [Aeromicrobium sp.]
MAHRRRFVVPRTTRRTGRPGSQTEWPRPSLRFRERSVFDGVARREVGGVDLLAHSVAVLVPSLTALGSGLALPTLVGPGFWISTLLGFGLVGLLVMTFNQFASRFKSAGTLYTFVAKGFGPLPALMVGGALVIGYSAIIGFGLSDASSRFDAAVDASGFPLDSGAWRVGLLFLACVLMCLYAIGRGIHWTTRAALLAEAVGLGVLVIVFWAWTARYGLPTWDALSLDGASPTRILLGAATIVTLTLAFESSASLGLETKQPMRDVPFALRTSLLLAAGLFVLANFVATTRPPDAPSIWSWRWFAPGADRSIADALVLVVLAWSLVALAMCVWCALARLLFSLAREGVLPGVLGRVDGRGIPMTAVLAVTPLALAVPTAAIVTGADIDAFSWELKQSAAVVICAAYALAALALPRFLWSIDELSWAPVAAALAAGTGATAVAVTQLVTELRAGTWLALGLLAVSALSGLLMRWWVSTSTTLGDRYIGMHDEAVASAVVLPPEPPHGVRVDV